MNYTSRNDDVEDHPDWNQSPQDLNSDATTRADLNGIVNSRAHRQEESSPNLPSEDAIQDAVHDDQRPPEKTAEDKAALPVANVSSMSGIRTESSSTLRHPLKSSNVLARARDVLVKYAGFVGPGFLIAVAYIDPGN